MRTVFVMFDSLNRRSMGCYGGTLHTPNFDRYAARSVVFDNHYVGSLPCMPARRDLHTGRLNFLHRSWGPLEPFDASFPEILARSGTHTHLLTDHYHYFEDGGATYHNRYTTWDCVRGQEWDPFIPVVAPPVEEFSRQYHRLQYDDRTKAMGGNGRLQSMINRRRIDHESDYTLVQCVEKALQFLECNAKDDNWLLQLECFDPHEPFMAPERFRRLYPRAYDGPVLDWPRYARVQESPDEIAELQANYASLLSMCDAYFGKILDYFDEHGLWNDTALILTTDHGYMLGEHDWWAKNRMPVYQEIAHIPLIIHHPYFQDQAGSRRSGLTQTPDIMPTILDFHGKTWPETVTGKSLLPAMASDIRIHDSVIYGMFGGSINVTDGRHTYFRYPLSPDTRDLWEYTLMPTHHSCPFAKKEFENASLVNTFAFTAGFPVMKLPACPDAKRPPIAIGGFADGNTVLYDLQADPGQMTPLDDPETQARLTHEMARLMIVNEAPPEAFERLSLGQSCA